MIEIAIIEDNKEQAALLESHIRKYAAEHKTAVSVSVFYNVITFLEKYTAAYHIVYMDIMMPMMNGMDAAKLLREKDGKVILIFVTSMRQYAVQGYEVAATDFIVKPVTYPEFALKFTKILARLERESPSDIRLKTETGFVRLSPGDIAYVEVKGHHCVYHTSGGEYRQYQTIKSVEADLGEHGFLRCNNYLLVNLAYVTKIDGMSAFVDGEELPISYPRRKSFTDAANRSMEQRKND